MKWYLDTEFYERPGRIDLISIGLVSSDGQEFYAENVDFDWGNVTALAHHPDPRMAQTPNWLLENVKPFLAGNRLTSWDMASEIRKIVGNKPEFYGWYCDYDWVVFCWIFGRMIDLPKGFPMFCHDLRQTCKELHVDTQSLPAQGEVAHNALNDARWNKRVHDHLKELHRVPS